MFLEISNIPLDVRVTAVGRRKLPFFWSQPNVPEKPRILLVLVRYLSVEQHGNYPPT